MSITAGVLPLVLAKSSTMWPNDMVAADFMPEYQTMVAIKEQQTAQLQTVNLPDGVDVKIAWLNQCDLTVDTCNDNVCTFTGPEADASSQTLSIDQCKEVLFSEKIDIWRDNIFGQADAIAANLNKAMKQHLEQVAQYSVGVINANLGVNTYTNGGTWTVSGTSNTIPADQWGDTSIFGKLLRAAKKNRLDTPYLLDGENLDQLIYMAKTNAGNAEGKGDALRVGGMPVYTDLFNVDTVNDPTLITYLINRGALAFASKGYFPTTPEKLTDTYMRFSIPNRWFPSLIHDVEVNRTCTSGVWQDNYRVKARYKLFVNPTGCTATRTGMIAFTKEAGI